MRRGQLTRAELEILEFICDNQPATVRQVAEHASRTNGHARTTVLTVMERLRRKGFLRRRKVDGVNRYSSCLSKAEVRKDLISQFVNGFLGGSLSPFFAYLTDSDSLTDAEISQLEQTLHKLKTCSKDRET